MKIMGILNITPDSFSDGGKYLAIDSAIGHAALMIGQGADIIDIGAESTRPGHIEVCAQEEMARLLPVLRELRKTFPTAKFSVDTYKGEVAKAALEAGADMINDVWGGMRGIFFGEPAPSTAEVVAAFGCPIILMHNRPQNMRSMQNLESEIFEDFEAVLKNAKQYGVADKNIILDGGFGFAKTPAQNIELVRNYASLRKFGFPLLLGLSKKSTLRARFGDVGANDATLAFDMWACVGKACDIIRVHDVGRHKIFAESQSLIENSQKWTK